MPLLETLRVDGSLLVDGRVSLKSSQSLKKLVIRECENVIPANIIPSTVEKVTIHNYAERINILEQVVFPPSLTHLTVSGDCKNPIKLPQSLVKLKMNEFTSKSGSVFRLDEGINHTNVRDLSIIIENGTNQPPTTYQFSIQRLDADNRNVLVLEKQTMTGGIITQRKQEHESEYDPINLRYTGSNSTFELKWFLTYYQDYDGVGS
ncbi:hypothetical protein DFA_06332 [Cavenderia fasciculata]|uniref:Uncharacterized protein n=1 Tax=Cavenderia fasciculata TaxID=261658 RepID=F4PKR1_CACFS|nr:uncharacterized protein DFA_06332 [Cavenderia fasciculata]EGG24185.1 hypothetical protein DFA_06332 [Cavenderia fasciculata]|eukprot:XP_004362036.1 hypothetical protein DFA_06332 [Cavenderia fasciculata]